MSENPIFHSIMKHLALDYYFFQELVQFKRMHSHISSTDQLADALTKPLLRARLIDLSVKIELSKPRPS